MQNFSVCISNFWKERYCFYSIKPKFVYFVLFISVLRRFEDRRDLHFNVTEGANVVLPCQPPYSRPKAKIMFKINGTSIIDENTGKRLIEISDNATGLSAVCDCGIS